MFFFPEACVRDNDFAKKKKKKSPICYNFRQAFNHVKIEEKVWYLFNVNSVHFIPLLR